MKKLSKLTIFFLLPYFLSAQNYFEPLGGPIGLDVWSSFKDANGVLYIKAFLDFGAYRHLKSFDDGDTWIPVMIDDSTQVERLYADEVPNLYAIDKSGELYRSDENGNDWSSIFLTNSPTTHNKLSISPSGDLFLFTAGSLFLSTDKGDSWSFIAETPLLWDGAEFHPNGNMYAIMFVNWLYLASSTDGGNNWDEVFTSPSPYFSFPALLTVHLSNGGDLYVKGRAGDFVSYAEFFISIDDGNTFEPLITPSDFSSSFLTTDDSEDLFFSDTYKIFISKNKGQTWVNISSGLPASSQIHHIYIDDNQYIYLSLKNNVLYKSVLPSNQVTDIEGLNNESIKEFKIYSNPTTSGSLKFSFISNRFFHAAHFRVVDVSGKIMKEIEDGLPQETHIVPVWDWAAGVYFLQYLEGGQVRHSERFVVLKK